MRQQVENLRSTCTLTEMVLSGKDIELLLLKKDVQDKLLALGDIDIKNLPATVARNIQFIPGAVDFGYLEDADEHKPVSIGASGSLMGDGTGRRAVVSQRATQTD